MHLIVFSDSKPNGDEDGQSFDSERHCDPVGSVASQLLSDLQDISNGGIDPANSIGQLDSYLQAISVEALLLPTVALRIGIIGIEILVSLINRRKRDIG